MKLSRRHLILLSIIGILVIINYVLYQSQTKTTLVDAYSDNIRVDGKTLPLEKIQAVLNEVSTTSSTTVNEQATTSLIIEPSVMVRQKSSDSVVSILHFGDTMFDRNVRKRMNSGVDLFSSLRSLNIMSDYDIRMLNLEGPIVEMDRSKCQQKAYNFQFASNTAKMLKEEGFTSVTIANNHIYDCYRAGIDSTLKYLNISDIDIVGAPLKNDIYKIVTTKEGAKIALVGIDTTINPPPPSSFFSLIKKLKAENDFVLVSMHSGVEYAPRATLEQKNLAHSIIDAGADVVIGNHPHVVENMEVYNSGVIFYSLGNFIFDQIGDKENQGLGVGLSLSATNIEIMLLPYNIINSVPTFMSMENSNTWCQNYYGVTPFITPEGCFAAITR